jgi:hypothetical protein
MRHTHMCTHNTYTEGKDVMLQRMVWDYKGNNTWRSLRWQDADRRDVSGKLVFLLSSGFAGRWRGADTLLWIDTCTAIVMLKPFVAK